MWSTITLILQIFYLWIKNSFEKDTEEKKRKEDLRTEAKNALSSGDSNRMVDLLARLRNED